MLREQVITMCLALMLSNKLTLARHGQQPSLITGSTAYFANWHEKNQYSQYHSQQYSYHNTTSSSKPNFLDKLLSYGSGTYTPGSVANRSPDGKISPKPSDSPNYRNSVAHEETAYLVNDQRSNNISWHHQTTKMKDQKQQSENSIKYHRSNSSANSSTGNSTSWASSSYRDYLTSIPIIGPFTHGIIEEIQHHVHFIKPGTKWCGDGNKARNYQDVGVLYKTDACCREHDKCPHYILSHENKYGLYNDAHWTRSHCDCDMALYNCLKGVNTPFSTTVGYTYFNVLKMKCFKMEFPVVMCVHSSGWFTKQCTQYVVDMAKEKQWQWFDNYEY